MIRVEGEHDDDEQQRPEHRADGEREDLEQWHGQAAGHARAEEFRPGMRVIGWRELTIRGCRRVS